MAERKQIADLFCYRTTGRKDEEKFDGGDGDDTCRAKRVSASQCSQF